jgi:hypothetical protein
LPFFIGGVVAGTFGLSITDDSSPLKGWVAERKRKKKNSNKNRTTKTTTFASV